jgi:hypothetical protein
MHTTVAIESSDSPAPGIIPEPLRMHDQAAATTARGCHGRSLWTPGAPPDDDRFDDTPIAGDHAAAVAARS